MFTVFFSSGFLADSKNFLEHYSWQKEILQEGNVEKNKL
jgi:hypothetical protein